MSEEKRKTLIRWFGGKNRLAPWIVDFFPEHTTYVEPFGGSGAVLLNKRAAKLEVYNDLFGRIVNFFAVLRDPEKTGRLVELIRLTPYAQTEYEDSFTESEDPVEDVRRFAVNSMMSFGGGGHKSGFRRNGVHRTPPLPESWKEYPEIVLRCAEELQRRNIEVNQTDAIRLMKRYDSPSSLFYVDPPYIQETRTSGIKYPFEYDRNDHERLLDYLQVVKSKVVLSGYDCDLYNQRLSSWYKETKRCVDSQYNSRTECLWMNFQPQMNLL